MVLAIKGLEFNAKKLLFAEFEKIVYDFVFLLCFNSGFSATGYRDFGSSEMSSKRKKYH